MSSGAAGVAETYLVRGVGSQDVEQWRDELRLDRDCFVALLLSRSECLLNGIDPRGHVTCKLDIRTKLDGLRRESPGDGGNEDRLDVLGNGCREGCKDSVLFAVQIIFNGYWRSKWGTLRTSRQA